MGRCFGQAAAIKKNVEHAYRLIKERLLYRQYVKRPDPTRTELN